MIRDKKLNYTQDYIKAYDEALIKLQDVFDNSSIDGLTPDETKLAIIDACEELKLRTIIKLRDKLIKDETRRNF